MIRKPNFGKPASIPALPHVHIHIEFDPNTGNARMQVDTPINPLVMCSILSGMAKAQADNVINQASGLINLNKSRQPIEEPMLGDVDDYVDGKSKDISECTCSEPRDTRPPCPTHDREG